MKELLESPEVQKKLNKLGVTLVPSGKSINIELDVPDNGPMLDREEKIAEAIEYIKKLLGNSK